YQATLPAQHTRRKDHYRLFHCFLSSGSALNPVSSITATIFSGEILAGSYSITASFVLKTTSVRPTPSTFLNVRSMFTEHAAQSMPAILSFMLPTFAPALRAGPAPSG